MQNLLTLDQIFSSDDFKTRSFGPARWLDDETGYVTLENAPDLKGVKEIVRYAIPSGERSVLVAASQLQPPEAESPLVIKNYAWSEDKKRLLIFTNTRRVWRHHTRGDYWVLDLQTGRLTQVGRTAKPASLMFAKFSPNGRYVAYVYNQNIYVEAVAGGGVYQLTHDGGDNIVNGTSDWVYEEEFFLRDCFSWSPDGTHIAYWQFDTDGIDTFYMINNTDSLYPKLTPLPYPKAGTVNSACRVGVVAALGGDTIWFGVDGDPRQHYIPHMSWAANSEQVVIQQLNRLQNQIKVLLGNVVDGSVETVLVEQDEAWVDVRVNDLTWLDNGRSFLWSSERDGWRHLYRISRNGRTVTLLTPGAYDVIRVLKVVEENDWVYFVASPDNATQRYLFRVSLDGGEAERLTPLDSSGTHAYQLSPKGSWAFHTHSAFGQPPAVSLVSLPTHARERLLEGNAAVRERMEGVAKTAVEFFKVKLEDGMVLDGWCLKPPDFDASKQYPVLFYVYGEPAGQTVLDSWGGNRYLWHQFLAQQGIVVMSVDNRGTPAPKGRDWRKCVYRQVGILTTADQAAAAKKVLAERPFLDPERVAVWGWSGGGSMTLNLLFKHGDIYKTGISVAAVSDMRLYDTIYQERYMGLPAENEVGYRDGSPITFAHQLEGNLLIVHGTADDNVHYQCFESVVNKLIEHNKQFAMMSYPNRAHGINEGKNTSRHLHGLMREFLRGL
ncbi:MAG: S9 family peptidase [Chloroflexota bacterium]